MSSSRSPAKVLSDRLLRVGDLALAEFGAGWRGGMPCCYRIFARASSRARGRPPETHLGWLADKLIAAVLGD